MNKSAFVASRFTWRYSHNQNLNVISITKIVGEIVVLGNGSCGTNLKF